MSQLSLTHLRRGPTSTLIFSIARYNGDRDLTLYNQTINADDSIQALIRFMHKNSTIQPYVKIKNKNGHNFALPIFITCGTFNKLFFCSANWVEVELGPVPAVSSKKIELYNNVVYISLYTIEINITVQNITPTLMLPNKELYENASSTDFQLRTADGNVAVHKEIMFLYSHMFKMMLNRDWKEKAEGRISMDGVTVQTLRHLKDYMYLGTLPDEGLEQLLLVAAHYFMDKLRADCSAKLVEKVSPENFDRLVALACEFNIPELVKGLVFRIPDSVINGIYDLKFNEQLQLDENKKTT